MPLLLSYVHKLNKKLVVKLFNMPLWLFDFGPFTIIELRALKGSFSIFLTFIQMHFWFSTYMHSRLFFFFFIAEPIKMCTAVNDRSHETTHSDTQQGTTFTMTVTFSVMFDKVFKMVTKDEIGLDTVCPHIVSSFEQFPSGNSFLP